VKILFDQNVPRNLHRHLAGHEVTAAARLGWRELKNGDLLTAAESKGFEVLVTGDRNLEHQQNLTERKIAIVVLTRNNWPLIKPHGAETVEAVDGLTEGAYRGVDCSKVS
jgi:predicted nuclease of predicted toxin-antitoxin system